MIKLISSDVLSNHAKHVDGVVLIKDNHYVLIIDGEEEYRTQQYEAMASHIDMIIVFNRFS